MFVGAVRVRPSAQLDRRVPRGLLGPGRAARDRPPAGVAAGQHAAPGAPALRRGGHRRVAGRRRAAGRGAGCAPGVFDSN